MLEVHNVSKNYGKTLACNDVSFKVKSGEIAVLVGPNGAGKSTIIKCIAGLLRFSGSITIDGNDNKSLEAKRLLGYVPEIPSMYDLLTVGEHLQFVGRAYRCYDKDFADYLLDRFELTDKRDKLGKELSKGMQQKVSICCALMSRPRLVIFDEPLVGLDPHAIKVLKQEFVKLKEAGCAVLISTHMLDSVENYWDVAQIMMNGSFAATKFNRDDGGKSLEDLFFEITEGKEAQE